jgi:hypothetical protein
MLDGSRMHESTHPNEPLPLHIAARHLRVPARWLRDEIESGRLPALRAGRAILVHVPTVATALVERAKAERAADQAEGGDA